MESFLGGQKSKDKCRELDVVGLLTGCQVGFCLHQAFPQSFPPLFLHQLFTGVLVGVSRGLAALNKGPG